MHRGRRTSIKERVQISRRRHSSHPHEKHGLILLSRNFPFCGAQLSLSTWCSIHVTVKTTTDAMGVKGLLPLLRSIQKHTHLRQYNGQTLGIDGFGWLHRGACACALQLALDRPTTRYIDFVVNRVRMLLDFGITPYLVFDGDALPSKAMTNHDRRTERKAAKELGLSLYRSGKTEAAEQEFQKAVTVTPDMTFRLIRELRRMNVAFIVAPYEADAQLVYLERHGIIDGVISEDSDLLVFGVKRLITKLDQHGDCIEINRADFAINRELNLAGWSDSMFRRMAIMSGCDYLPGINRVGLKTAHGFVKKHKDMHKILRVLSFNGKYTLPPNYTDDFRDAERAFLYHRVFCPKRAEVVHLNELPPDVKASDMPFLGEDVLPEIAVAVAAGEVDPKTKKPFSLNLDPPRPVLQDKRRQTLAATELKPKRSLDSFFRPSRQPLAELDPNSLTPSPSQQRLLERHRHSSWEPDVVNSAPPLRRSITDTLSPRRSFSTSSQSRSNFLARASTASSYKPVKRQRLCSDRDDVSASQEVTQSRFFCTGELSHSPLLSRKARTSRVKAASFDVWSEDDAGGILSGLEHGLDTTVEYPSLPALDHPAEQQQATPAADSVPQSSPVITTVSFVDSQSSHGTVDLSNFTFQSQSVTAPEVVRQVNHHDDPEEFIDLLEYHVTQINQGLPSQLFDAQSPAKQVSALASLRNADDAECSILPPVVSRSTSDRQMHKNEASLGHEEGSSPDTIVLASPARPSIASITKTFLFQSNEQQTRALKSLAPRAQLTLATATPIPSRSSLRDLGVIDAQGTEDFLVSSPRSEDYVSEAEDTPKPTFNLGRFLCRT